jgi:ubiquinol-cytochrome c reductase cytochrome b/c1 subunit
MLTNLKSLAFAAALSLTAALSAQPVLAAGAGPQPPQQDWTFAGPFGHFDKAQLQRGFQIYKEVCSACHGIKLLSFRNLSQPGGPEFTPGQVQTLASEWPLKVKDINDVGDTIERAPRPADKFPYPFANEAQGRAANNGAYPPDLSVIAKARTYLRGFPWFIFDIFTQYAELGPNYIYAFLTGYKDPPAGVKVLDGLNYNEYFPGNQVAMPNILADGLVQYTDGTPMTVSQYAKDVTAFLMWAAEPKLEERKRLGFQVMLFLVVFAGLMYFTKKRVWRDVAHA